MPGGTVMVATFTFPIRIRFGEGAVAELAPELNRLGVRRPLIVTDPGIVAAGLLERSVAGVPAPVVFDRVQANPTEGDVLDALAAYRDGGCDGIVGLGGGSPIDAAKAVRLLMPPSRAPIIIDLRASRSEPSWTLCSRPLETCRRPSSAMPSQIGWKVVER